VPLARAPFGVIVSGVDAAQAAVRRGSGRALPDQYGTRQHLADHAADELVCSYPVPRNIGKRQWVDMQGIVVHACSHTVADGPKEFTGGAIALVEDRVKARRHRVERSALLQAAFGAALAVLALWRPFPSSLTPGQADQITGVVAALGAALVTLSFLRLAVENSPRALPIGRTRETLEMIVDGLLKR
jgi:hypothetical protein